MPPFRVLYSEIVGWAVGILAGTGAVAAPTYNVGLLEAEIAEQAVGEFGPAGAAMAAGDGFTGFAAFGATTGAAAGVVATGAIVAVGLAYQGLTPPSGSEKDACVVGP